jgi:pyocin large subunit-like protein
LTPVAPRGWIDLRDLPKGETFLQPPATSTWSDPVSLTDHFVRHGAEFDSTSEEDYAGKANAFLQRSISDGYLRRIDSYGATRIYDPNSNTFGVYNSDGTTRTFFKPTDPSYFLNQSNQWNTEDED